MRVTKEQIKDALSILGLDFTDEQLAMMLPAVNRALLGYEGLRKVDIPLDTEPAFHFRPSLPGEEPKPRPSRFTPTRVTKLAAFKDPEELAFLPVTELAPLLRARKISSTDLTKMYLARLKKYSPKLLCVITLTEDLALEQAAQADKEIAAGKYRGPLHGIAFGAKDLFATKGIKTTWGAEPFEDQMISYNCTAVDRLEKAGAVLVAEDVHGSAGTRRPLVRRSDEESVEYRAGFERLLRGLGILDLGWPRGIFDWDGNVGIDCQPQHALRGCGPASHLRTSEPLRRHGALLDHGQDRADLPFGGRLRSGAACDVRARRA